MLAARESDRRMRSQPPGETHSNTLDGSAPHRVPQRKRGVWARNLSAARLAICARGLLCQTPHRRDEMDVSLGALRSVPRSLQSRTSEWLAFSDSVTTRQRLERACRRPALWRSRTPGPRDRPIARNRLGATHADKIPAPQDAPIRATAGTIGHRRWGKCSARLGPYSGGWFTPSAGLLSGVMGTGMFVELHRCQQGQRPPFAS